MIINTFRQNEPIRISTISAFSTFHTLCKHRQYYTRSIGRPYNKVIKSIKRKNEDVKVYAIVPGIRSLLDSITAFLYSWAE